MLRTTTACTFSTSQLPKVVRTPSVLYILTWKCASRHNGVHFFDISTSKSGPKLRCFVHFDFEMCFALQRRALFRHLNFQKWSEPGVFCTFWLGNVLRATTACNFSSLLWPVGSAPAALASLLFNPLEPQIIGKTQCFATFLPFRASASSFFLTLSLLIFFFYGFLFSLPLPCSAFHVHIVGSLTSKLPSDILFLTCILYFKDPYLHFSFHVALAVSFWTESGMECWVERHTTAPSPQVHWAHIPVEVPWLLNVTWLTCLFLILMATVIMVVSVVGIFFVTPWLPILREYGFQHWKHRLKGKPR